MDYRKIQNNNCYIQSELNTQLFSKLDESNNNNNSETCKEETNIYKYNNPIKSKYVIMIIITLFLIFFLLLYLQQNKIQTVTTELNNSNTNTTFKLNNNSEIIPLNQDIFKEERFPSRAKSFKIAFEFLSNNTKGIITKEIPNEPIENPIASAVIPIYNSKNYITRAIRSIQNQNIKDIEIILINDYSTDGSLSLITEMQKEDKRIKIINNKKNLGILYSRCIGTLSAKGKYIFPLDNDDMFLDQDVFSVITNIAEKGFFDIVEFKGIFSNKGDENNILKNKISDTHYANHPLNLVLYQPQLGNYQIWPEKSLSKYHLESVYLWGKCIRAEIYKKTINKLGKEKYSRFVLRYEDIIMNYALFNTARSYKFVGKYGIFYIYRSSSASRHFTSVESVRYHIYYLDTMIDFVQDTIYNKRILVNLLMYILNRKDSLKITLKNNYINKIFINCLDTILKMDKISDEFKSEIRQRGKVLKFINYEF